MRLFFHSSHTNVKYRQNHNRQNHNGRNHSGQNHNRLKHDVLFQPYELQLTYIILAEPYSFIYIYIYIVGDWSTTTLG